LRLVDGVPAGIPVGKSQTVGNGNVAADGSVRYPNGDTVTQITAGQGGLTGADTTAAGRVDDVGLPVEIGENDLIGKAFTGDIGGKTIGHRNAGLAGEIEAGNSERHGIKQGGDVGLGGFWTPQETGKCQQSDQNHTPDHPPPAGLFTARGGSGVRNRGNVAPAQRIEGNVQRFGQGQQLGQVGNRLSRFP